MFLCQQRNHLSVCPCVEDVTLTHCVEEPSGLSLKWRIAHECKRVYEAKSDALEKNTGEPSPCACGTKSHRRTVPLCAARSDAPEKTRENRPLVLTQSGVPCA